MVSQTGYGITWNILQPKGGMYYHKYSTIARSTQQREEDAPSPQLKRMLAKRPHLELTGSITLEGEYPVYSGTHSESWKATRNEKPVRAKVMRYIGYASDVERCTSFEQGIINGIEKWEALSHPNIVPFLGCSRGFGTTLTLVYPWLSGGNALDYVKSHPEANRLKIVAEVADGLSYLHGHNVVHGDLRCNNVLIHESASGPVAMISDTGVAISMGFDGSTDQDHGAERWISLQYAAPGNVEEEISSMLTPESDVWSYGMFVYELFTEKPPLDERQSHFRLAWVLRRGEVPQYPGVDSEAAQRGLSQDAWELVQSCWDAERTRRPSATQIAVKTKALCSSRIMIAEN
ncbi:hypothetical protein NLI96_g5134 [Meripilus lineatus]|uniref:Protein kinase domain-containing protein n=1 Tax=Meripilus lineatus TaxID=2056292 RepID=A0AAD5V885_9APHY|nr:hypothetical protein NLI96_g5134 [Physisporinus lineatus]